MQLVLRCNFSDDSLALMQWLKENPDVTEPFKQIHVCIIDTGWAAKRWEARQELGIKFAKSLNYNVVQLKAPAPFEALCLERKAFPSKKFQWCAGFLKGLPLIEWLDEVDPACEWTIAIPKRQALYRQELPQRIESCEYHGERRVWHPILDLTSSEHDALLKRAAIKKVKHRSLECEPCVNSTLVDLKNMQKIDIQRVDQLERKLNQHFFPQHNMSVEKRVLALQQVINTQDPSMDQFSMGCGDPFGCGL